MKFSALFVFTAFVFSFWNFVLHYSFKYINVECCMYTLLGIEVNYPCIRDIPNIPVSYSSHC